MPLTMKKIKESVVDVITVRQKFFAAFKIKLSELIL
jgi:hypothetical protein